MPSAPLRPASLLPAALELGDTTYVVVLIAELVYQQALLTRIQAQANRLTDTAACSRRWAAAGGTATPTRCRRARVRAADRLRQQPRRCRGNAIHR